MQFCPPHASALQIHTMVFVHLLPSHVGRDWSPCLGQVRKRPPAVGSSLAVHRAFDARSWSGLVPKRKTQNCPAADVWWDALYTGLIVNPILITQGWSKPLRPSTIQHLKIIRDNLSTGAKKLTGLSRFKTKLNCWVPGLRWCVGQAPGRYVWLLVPLSTFPGGFLIFMKKLQKAAFWLLCHVLIQTNSILSWRGCVSCARSTPWMLSTCSPFWITGSM